MTAAPMDYDEFWDMIKSAMNEFQNNMNSAINEVQRQFNERVNAIPAWEWGLKPWLVVTVNRGVDALQDKANELWDSFEENAPKIWEQVNAVQGDPVTLTLLSNTYLNATRVLSDIGESYLPDAIGRVQDAWSEGEGPAAFGRQAPKQSAAALGASAGLMQASTACGEASGTIVSSWLDIHSALLSYARSIIDAIKDGTDVGQIITLDVGPALKVVLDAVASVVELANTLIRYVADDATAGATKWKSLESGSELGGLMDGNTWPTISGLDGRDLTNGSKW